MNYLKRTCTALAVLTAMLALSTAITACNGSADAATTGVTMAQVNAAIADAVAPLKKQIADQADQIKALQASSGSSVSAKLAHLYVTIAAPNAATVQTASLHTESYGDSSSGVQTMATTDTCSGLGTLTGHPNSSDPRTSDKLAGVSCTGYLFTVVAAPSGSNSHLMPLGTPEYIQPNCQGAPYYTANSLSALAIQNGVVFSLPDQMVSDWSDPINYYYIPAKSTPIQITPVSVYDATSPGACEALISMPVQAYQATPNDPSVTDMPSGLIPGPVGMGTVQ